MPSGPTTIEWPDAAAHHRESITWIAAANHAASSRHEEGLWEELGSQMLPQVEIERNVTVYRTPLDPVSFPRSFDAAWN